MNAKREAGEMISEESFYSWVEAQEDGMTAAQYADQLLSIHDTENSVDDVRSWMIWFLN